MPDVAPSLDLSHSLPFLKQKPDEQDTLSYLAATINSTQINQDSSTENLVSHLVPYLVASADFHSIGFPLATI